MNTYREACDACEARKALDEKVASSILPFEKNITCPACLRGVYTTEKGVTQRTLNILSWPICTGTGKFRIRTGYWFFGRRGDTLFDCAFKTAVQSHFHLHCLGCGHFWMMKTALSLRLGLEIG